MTTIGACSKHPSVSSRPISCPAAANILAMGRVTNSHVQIIVASTTIFLAAGRFGLTPSANRLASPGLKLQTNNSGLKTGDPAGAFPSIIIRV